MSDIDAMQSRIMAALDRIGQGLDGFGAAPADAADEGELGTMRQQIEDERLANAQLEERVKQLSARARDAEAKLAAVEASASEAADQQTARAKSLKKIDSDLQALRQANQQLRDNNSALREANAKGVSEPHLINKAMMAELDGLRASRAADRSEIDVILGELARITDAGETGETANANGKGMENA
jgi:chromosome segregation ATPase